MLFSSRLILLLVCASLWGGQSVAPSAAATVTLPSTAPFTAVGDYRLEAHVHGCTQTAAYQLLLGHANFQIRQVGGAASLEFDDNVDSNQGLGNIVQSYTGHTDFTIRFQRDSTLSRYTVEMWDTQTGSRWYVGIRRLTLAALNLSGTFTIGGASTTCNIGAVRQYASVVALNSAPPKSRSGTGDLGSWELEGNGTDDSGRALTLTTTGVTYTTTPTGSPVACFRVSGNSYLSIRAGASNTLDSCSYTNSDGALTLQWQQTAGPSTTAFSSRTAASTTITGTVAGEYTYQLVASDGTNSTTLTQAVGAVATDSNGVIISGDANADFLFGPALRLGVGPWPYADRANVEMAATYGGLAASATAGTSWDNTWQTAKAGTVSFTNGTTTVTGTGTSFQADYCGGGTTPTETTHIVLFSSPKQRLQVTTCGSNTSLTVAADASISTVSGVQHSKMINLAYLYWGGAEGGVGGSDNANYYDSVLAHYALHYRSGLTQYRTYARTVADRWTDSPFFAVQAAPRLWALSGIMWRAYESSDSALWTRLHTKLDAVQTSADVTTRIPDVREQAYEIAFLGIGGKLSPDSVRRTNYTTAVTNAAANRWTPQRKANGQWENLINGYSPWNGQAGTVTLTNGSTTVTGSGTNWQSSWASGGYDKVWFTADNNGTNPDTVYFTPYTWVSATSITLPRGYDGINAGAGKAWQFCSNLCGVGTQPFQLGLAGSSWEYARRLTSSSTMSTFVSGISTWLRDYGGQATTRGGYYGRGFANCEPIADNLGDCSYDPAQTTGDHGQFASRYLVGEMMGGMAAGYIQNSSSTVKSKADDWMGACLGVDGGPNATTDQYDCRELVEDTGIKAKGYGFFFGYGGTYRWPAARLGGQAASSNRTLLVGVNLASVPNATQVRLTLTKPDSSTVTATCSSSPCSITADARQADHLLKVEYLSAGNAVLAVGSQQIAAVQ